MHSGKGDRMWARREAEKEDMGFVYAVFWCAQTPPPPLHHLSPILRILPHLPAAMVIRTEGTAGRPPTPLPPVNHTPFLQLEAIAVDL
jgi:hypothetical protein